MDRAWSRHFLEMQDYRYQDVTDLLAPLNYFGPALPGFMHGPIAARGLQARRVAGRARSLSDPTRHRDIM